MKLLIPNWNDLWDHREHWIIQVEWVVTLPQGGTGRPGIAGQTLQGKDEIKGGHILHLCFFQPLSLTISEFLTMLGSELPCWSCHYQTLLACCLKLAFSG